MKPATLRKSGQKMFTVRVQLHIGLDELVQGVVVALLNDVEFKRTRKGVFAVTVDEYSHRGDSFYYAHEGTNEPIDDILKEARELVAKLFPEL